METVPFEDPLAKVDNAREHIGLVETRFETFCATEPVFHTKRHGSEASINFGSGNPLPKNVAMAAGDALHNLRSALDIMAGDVVQASGQSRKGVYFPFARSAEELDRQIKEKKFDRASAEAIELLKSFKPFKGGNAALRALHDLDVSDKHQFIIPTARHTRFSMRIGNVVMINCSSGENGRGDIGIGRGAPFSIPQTSPKLVFGPKQPLAGDEVIPALHSLADLTLTIVQAFEALFASGRDPTPSDPSG
jgi:hypothetical protein